MTANFTLFFVVVFLVATWTGWEWPYIAKLMPVYVAAIPGLLLTLVQLYREMTDWEGGRRKKGGGIEMDEVFTTRLDRGTEMRRTAAFFGWLIGGALAIWLLGIAIALPCWCSFTLSSRGGSSGGFPFFCLAVPSC
ncbi:MAG: hypothetical protein ACREQA_23990 [Candidatus Binatia bacterium]